MNIGFCRDYVWRISLCMTLSFVAAAHGQDQTDYDQQLGALLPAIGHTDIEQRRESQQTWEKTCLEAGAKGREDHRAAICVAMTKQLGDEVPGDARVFLLRQLERIGGAESVAAIAESIESDAHNVRDAAIRALSANPDQTAGDALFTALENTRDRQAALLLVKALGYRGDSQCVEFLTTYCKSFSREHRDAALIALAKIETPDAEAAIRQFIEEDFRPSELEPYAEAYIVVANRRFKDGDAEHAARMYRKLAGENFKGPIRLAVAQGRLNTCAALGESPGELLETFLTSDDEKIQQVAAANVRQLDDAWIQKLADRISRYPESAQIALLRVLGPNRNRAALPGVMQAVESDQENIRVAALAALAGLADESAVPTLVRKMLVGGAEGEAAASSLEKVFAPGIDQRIVQLMKTTDEVERRKRLLQILDRRRATSALDAIIEEASHRDATVRKLAVDIFSRLGAESDISKMIAAWKTTADRGERDEMEKAIVAVCRRIPDPEQQCGPVLALYHSADAETQTELLPLLGRIGGEEVLQLVRADMTSETDNQRFAANVQALANWPNAKVTNDLMRVSTHEDPSLRIRSVRALARIVVLRDERTDEQRLKLLQQTMAKAERDEERDLILDRAKAIRTIETLRFVVPFLQHEKLRDRACRTIVDLAHHRGLREPNQAEFETALQQVIALTDDENLSNRAQGYLSK